MVPPPLSVSSRTAPTVLFVPLTISSLASAGCQVFKPLKFLDASQTLSAGAAMVTDFLTCSSRAAAALKPDTSSDIAKAVAVIIFMLSILIHSPPHW